MAKKVVLFPNSEARAAQFIEKVRDGMAGTVVEPEKLLKILPEVFERCIAFIFSELDYERNLKCNTAVAVRVLAVWAARAKDSLGGVAAKRTQAQAEAVTDPEPLRFARTVLSLPSREHRRA